MKGSVAAVVGVFFFFIPFFARSQGTNAGNAVVFSGTGDYIYTGALDFPAPWTASMWVNRQNSLDLSSALFYSGSGALKLEQFSGTRQVGFSKFGVGDYLFGYIAPAGIWTHLTFVATTTNMVLYVNGQARATNGNSIALPLSQFGRATGDRLNASVDEVAVWNYARSATEISNSYAFHFFAPAPGLVLLWHFDEPTNAAPVVLDASGNGYNGYFSNNLARAISTAPILTNNPVVTNLNDSGPGTLRDVLGVVGPIGGGGVTFAPALSGGTIYLTNFPVPLSGNVALDASGLSAGITLDGNTQTNIFYVTANAWVTLRGMGLTHGTARFGGAIFNLGTLTLDHVVFTNNSAIDRGTDSAGGGAIYSAGPLFVGWCAFSSNSATGGNSPASTFGGNAIGGAIYNNSTLLIVSNSTFSGNVVQGGLGLNLYGTGFGGAICTDGQLSASATVSQCTIVGNSAGPLGQGEGGGIRSLKPALIVNQCTIVSNSATTTLGGGISTPGTTTSLFNSVVAANGQYNLVGGLVESGSNLLIGSPKLAPLGNYGGPTQTMPPLSGSPATDSASDTALNLFSTDQRGQPRLSGSHVDIGAAEHIIPVISGASATLVSTNPVTGLRTVQFSAQITSDPVALSGGFQYSPLGSLPIKDSFVSATDAGTTNVIDTIAFPGGTAIQWNISVSNLFGTVSSPIQLFYVPTTGILGDLNGDGIVSQGELDQVYSNYLANSPFLLMTNLAGLGGTNVTFSLSNSLAGAYTVQYSTDFVTWSNLGPATPLYQFLDSNAPALPLRFYRLRYP